MAVGPTGHLPSIPVHGCDGRHGGWRGQDRRCRAHCALSYLPGVQKGQNCSSLGKEQGGDEGGVPGLAGTMSLSALGPRAGGNLLRTSSDEPCREVQSLFSLAKTLKR